MILVELSPQQLRLLDASLAGTVYELEKQAYHHSRRDQQCYKDDAIKCTKAAKHYRMLRDYLQITTEGGA